MGWLRRIVFRCSSVETLRADRADLLTRKAMLLLALAQSETDGDDIGAERAVSQMCDVNEDLEDLNVEMARRGLV